MTKKIIVCIILIVLGLNIFSPLSLALTISPAKFEFSADPGDTIKSQIALINEQDVSLIFRASSERLTVRGSYGEPVFTGEKVGLATWIEFASSTVNLAPGEEIRIPFTIEVPENADPGGHYAAVFWSTVPGEVGTGMGISMRVAALMLLRVSGEVIEEGEILNFKTREKLANYLPIDFSFKLKNTGTIHLKPGGEIVIKNIFGKITDILPINLELYSVLPKNERAFSVSWQPKSENKGKGFLTELKKERAGFALGYFKANLNLEYGEAKQTSQASVGFWVLPWRILLLSFLILIVVLLCFFQIIKWYNKWIIAKAGMKIKKRSPSKKLIKKRIVKRKKTRSIK